MGFRKFVVAQRKVTEEFLVHVGFEMMCTPVTQRTLPCASADEANAIAKAIAATDPELDLTLIADQGGCLHVGPAIAEVDEGEKQSSPKESIRRMMDPKVVVTIPSLGTDDAAGRAEVTVSLCVDGVRFKGECVMEGRSSNEYAKSILLRRET